jgi:hypothetical protein
VVKVVPAAFARRVGQQFQFHTDRRFGAINTLGLNYCAMSRRLSGSPDQMGYPAKPLLSRMEAGDRRADENLQSALPPPRIA